MAQRNTVQIIINAKDDASAVLGGVGGALEGLGKIALGATAAVAGAALGIGAAIGKLAIDAAPLQGVSAAFEGLADSAGIGAGEMLSALEEGSAGMIAQRDLMTSFNKAAQLVSVDFAQTLPDAMGSLGKVAAATGEDMGFLLDSLVTGVGRLSPMILDNLGIQVNLTEASEAWAEANGIAVEEMTKSQQQAALTAQVMEKLAENTAAMPDVTGTATASIAEMQATLQNTKDQIGLAFIPALQAMLQPVLKIAEDAGPKLIEWAQLAGEWLGRNLPNAIQAITSIFEGDFAQAVNSVRGIIARTFGGEGAAVFDDWVLKVQSGIQTVLDFFNSQVLPVFETVKAWFIENWPLIQAVALTAFEVIKEIAETVSNLFKEQIVPSFQRAFDNLTSALETLGLDWEDVWNAVKKALGIVAAAIGAIILGLIAVFTGFAQAIAGTIEFVTDKYQRFADAIKTWTEGLALVLTGNWEGILMMFRGVWEAIIAGFQLMFGTVINFVGEFIGGVVNFFLELKDQLVGNSIIPDMLADMLNVFVQGFRDIVDTVSQGISRIIRDIKSKASEFRAAALQVMSALIDGFEQRAREAVANMFTLGVNMITAIKSGVESVLADILNFFTGAIKSVIERVEDELGISSPSKVFFDIGKNIVDGLADGIATTAQVVGDLVLDSLNSMTREWFEWINDPERFFKLGTNLALNLSEGIVAGAESVGEAISSLLDVGGIISGLGGAAASILQRRTLDPLEEQIESFNDSIDHLTESLTGVTFGGEELLGLSIEELEQRLQEALHPRPIPGLGVPALNQELIDAIESALILRDLEEQRAEATQETLEAEQAIAELQRQQENLAFLQQQIRLLDLIAESGLDAGEILAGLQLGIDADALAVTQAMAAAMEQIIAQTEEQLGISSPSRVFQNIGSQLMLGLAQGVRDAEFIPRQAAMDATSNMVQTVNNNTVNMTVNTQATTSNVLADMQTARAMLGE